MLLREGSPEEAVRELVREFGFPTYAAARTWLGHQRRALGNADHAVRLAEARAEGRKVDYVDGVLGPLFGSRSNVPRFVIPTGRKR